MFTYSGIVVIGNPWILICHPQCNEWHCRAANQNPRASNYNNAIINEHYCYNIKLANSVFRLKQNYPCPVKLQDDDLSLCMILNSLNFNPKNGSKNSTATPDKLFECVWPFCGAGAKRVIKACSWNLFIQLLRQLLQNNLTRVQCPNYKPIQAFIVLSLCSWFTKEEIWAKKLNLWLVLSQGSKWAYQNGVDGLSRPQEVFCCSITDNTSINICT